MAQISWRTFSIFARLEALGCDEVTIKPGLQLVNKAGELIGLCDNMRFKNKEPSCVSDIIGTKALVFQARVIGDSASIPLCYFFVDDHLTGDELSRFVEIVRSAVSCRVKGVNWLVTDGAKPNMLHKSLAYQNSNQIADFAAYYDKMFDNPDHPAAIAFRNDPVYYKFGTNFMMI